MGSKRRGKKGKGKGNMKVGDEGSRNKTVTVMEEQSARKETVAETEKKESDMLLCVFLVRTRQTTTEEKSVSVLRGPVCRKEDFHFIDLRSKSVIPNYFPSILNCVGLGTMFMFNHQVYIFGDINQYHQLPVQHKHNVISSDNHIHKHTGSSRLSLLKRWEPFEMPGCNRNMVNPVALCDKLYCFGYPFLRPEVHDPWGSKGWNPLLLPDHLVEKRVSFPVLLDPLNNRVIVHFPDMGMLYAFYPTPDTDNIDKVEEDGYGYGYGYGGDWKCLVPKFYTWHYNLAIADNIIFFHDCVLEPDFAAYDMNTSTWLNIVWDLSKIDRFPMDFDAIFTLSHKGLMCLAGGFGTDVHFLRFRLKRTSDKDLILTAIDYQMHNIPPATGINDIILFLGNDDLQ
ncbi:uncharacterized protein LOC141643439 [Silene latifolia]|uniref:uncharacterized protein LOC141643439 n=1 Tax=Silene latifolia TaxID=37657 RepID=UPI003D771E0B